MATIESIVNSDKSSRFSSVQNVIVHELEGDPTELLPPGSGVVIMSKANSKEFDQLDKALSSKDKALINRIVNSNKTKVTQLRKVSSEDATKVLQDAQVYGDLIYDSRSIVNNVFTIDNIDFTRVFFPFIGGKFDNNFKFTSYTKKINSEPPKVMVVVHQPNLSKLEVAAIRDLPAKNAGMAFGKAGTVMLTPAAALFATVTAGLIVATGATAIGSCIKKFQGFGEEVVFPGIDKSVLSIHEIIAKRRELIAVK